MGAHGSCLLSNGAHVRFCFRLQNFRLWFSVSRFFFLCDATGTYFYIVQDTSYGSWLVPRATNLFGSCEPRLLRCCEFAILLGPFHHPTGDRRAVYEAPRLVAGGWGTETRKETSIPSACFLGCLTGQSFFSLSLCGCSRPHSLTVAAAV